MKINAYPRSGMGPSKMKVAPTIRSGMRVIRMKIAASLMPTMTTSKMKAADLVSGIGASEMTAATTDPRLWIQAVVMKVTAKPRPEMGTNGMNLNAALSLRVQAIGMKVTVALRCGMGVSEMKAVVATRAETALPAVAMQAVLRAGAIIAAIQENTVNEAIGAITAVRLMVSAKEVKDSAPLVKGAVSRTGIELMATLTIDVNEAIGAILAVKANHIEATTAAKGVTVTMMVTAREVTEAGTVETGRDIMVNGRELRGSTGVQMIGIGVAERMFRGQIIGKSDRLPVIIIIF